MINRRNFQILPLLFLLVLLIGCALQPVTDPRRPNPEEEPTIVPTAIAIEKPTYIVERGSVASQLFKSGRVAPVNQNQLSFSIGGRIDTLMVGKGGAVGAGDAVAQLDTAMLEQALQAAESELKLAKEQLAIAQESKATSLRRAEIGVELAQLRLDFALDEAGEAPTAQQTLAIEVLNRELELAQLNLGEFNSADDPSFSNKVAQNELQVERIKNQIAQSTLVAPISGTVMVVNFQEGDIVAAEEPLLVIADLNQIEVQAPLLDRELQELSEGLVAFGTFPSRPETSFPMSVRQLPYPYGTGSQENEADNFTRIAFDDPTQASELNIGDRIEIAILLDSRDGVLWLPPAAIREFNGRLFVVVQEGETQQRLDIKIGLQNDNQVEIISGVSEGQSVVGP